MKQTNGITCCCGNLGDNFNARILVGLVTVGLAFALTSSVALVAENMVSDWPALLPLHAGIKDQAAVLALETLGMKVLIHCSDPGSFGLAFFWYNGLCADTA